MSNKEKTIEQRYVKKTDIDHVLTVGEMYIGSMALDKLKLHYYDDATNKILYGELEVSLGLYKIVDEALVNVADNTIREFLTCNIVKVNIDKTQGTIQIYNNGSTIPIEMHREYGVYIPQLIFGELRTSENYVEENVDIENLPEMTIGGLHGIGIKTTNIFSTEFTVEIIDSERKLKYVQTFTNNMRTINPPVITKNTKDQSSVKVTFKPDYPRFGLSHLTPDMYSFLKRRVYDIAGTTNPNVKVYFNDSLINIKNFIDYVKLYYEPNTNIIHEKVNDRWHIAVVYDTEATCKQVSFVNNVSTYMGGTHYNYIFKQIVDGVTKKIKDAKKTSNLDIKPASIKSCLTIFINCVINRPKFNSQIKETLNNVVSKFQKGVKNPCELSDSFIDKICNAGLLKEMVEVAKLKEQRETDKQIAEIGVTKKTTTIRGIPKLEDAILAGHPTRSTECGLFLTEGDSAKSTAIQGLAKIGNEKYGVFPLKGKLLNVREAGKEQLLKNEEILAIIKIMGLDPKKQYATEKEFNTLRYGKIIIFSDQDDDGLHIKGLIENFVHFYWPNLMKIDGFISCLPTPLLKVKKSNGDDVAEFYTTVAYENWIKANNMRGLQIKYYKGLGSLTKPDTIKIFEKFDTSLISYVWDSTVRTKSSPRTIAGALTPPSSLDEVSESSTTPQPKKATKGKKAIVPDPDIPVDPSENAITLAFEKKRSDDRKQWLETYNPNDILDASIKRVTFFDCINKEVKHFSNADNIRSIPNLYDGFKPSQRKVMFCAFKKPLTSEIKVAQFAGYVSEHSAYHHGEASLTGTIINMVQMFVGANNIALLKECGQFGTRIEGGDDAASPRYIFTMLETITRKIFIKDDEHVLKYLIEDGQEIEPETYYPIIPMLLVNGCSGIGTGYSTKIPSYNPIDIITNIKLCIEKKPQNEMAPWYVGFEGTIEKNEKNVYECYGRAEIPNENTLKITELPVGTWTNNYKMELETLLEQEFMESFTAFPNGHIVNFTLTFPNGKLQELQKAGDVIDKKLKLKTNINTTNMHVYKNNKIVKYNSPNDIITDFVIERAKMYDVRQKFIITKLQKELDILKYTRKFIKENIDETIIVTKLSDDELTEILQKKKYPELAKNADETPSYNYLTELKIRSFTLTQVAKLDELINDKQLYLNTYSAKTPTQIWLEELDELLVEYNTYHEFRMSSFRELATGSAEVRAKAMGKGKKAK